MNDSRPRKTEFKMHPAQLILMYGVIPLWLAAGVADWACHKATSIESTTGTKESLIHILMLVEVGIPLVAALLLQINAALIATMFAAFALHEATALWDVSFASRSMRRVSPFEQHVHSYLELTPLLAIVCVAILHWPEVVALLDADAVADFRLRFKAHPLPAAYLAVTFACIACFGVFPFVEELWRCLRSKRQLHGSRPSHARAQ